jgi:hypothetical protein
MKKQYFFLIINISFFLFLNDANALSEKKCSTSIESVEKKYKIPHKLLAAISLTETGRTVDGSFISWPWSLNVSGKSFIFDNKENTKKFLKEKIDNEINNIDIGCMQINYKYHKKSFEDLNSFLDPEKNVEWAAKFLVSLHNKYKSWNTAISRYHSSNPDRMKKYLLKVHKNWKTERQKKYSFKRKKSKNSLSQKVRIEKTSESQFYLKNKEKVDFFRRELKKPLHGDI